METLEIRLKDRWIELLQRVGLFDINFSDDMTHGAGKLDDGTQWLYIIDDLLPKLIDPSVFKKGKFVK